MAITLNQNQAYSALTNAYRLIATLGDNLAGLDNTLADRYKISAGEYEDQIVYTFVDILKSRVWDPTDTNVLATEQQAPVSQQAIDIDQKRQIGLTIPAKMLTKQAWANPNNFDSFSSVVEAQIGNTRKIYDQRLVNTYIGTTESNVGLQTQTISLTGTNDALTIAEAIANIEVDLKDSVRDYNDKGYMLSCNKGDFDVIFNSKYANKIKNIDLPTIFHKDGLFEFKDVIPARYFGTPITTTNYSTYSASTPTAGKPINSSTGAYTPGSNHANGTLRALTEQDITVSGTTTHVFPGDELPANAVVYANSAVAIPCYIENEKAICKIIHKDAVKYASAIETSTEFFNSKNLSANKYLTWMYGNPDRLLVRPFITLKKA